MRPLNLRVILLLGGILLITLAFQVFQGYTVEHFADALNPAANTTPPSPEAAKIDPAKVETAKAEAAKVAPVAVNSVSGISHYEIPIGNNQTIKLTMPATTPTMVTTPQGPVPATTPPIK